MSCKIDEAIAELTRLLGVVGNKPAAESAVSNMLGDIKRLRAIKDGYEVSIIDSLPKYVTGQKTMTYAGIGSRQTPSEMLVEMTKAAKMLADRGYTLQTGKTFGNKEEGADKAFSDGTSKKMLFGPEEYGTNKTALDVVKKLHPAPDKLSAGAKKLMARNTFQVFGKKLDTPVDFVLFYAEETENPLRPKGGTGQAVEMARRNGVPTINMSEAGWEDKLAEILKQSDVVKTEPSINEKDFIPIDSTLDTLDNVSTKEKAKSQKRTVSSTVQQDKLSKEEVPSKPVKVNIDDLYSKVKAFVIESGKPDFNSVRQEFRTSYNDTVKVLEQLEKEGIVSTVGKDGKRTVLSKATTKTSNDIMNDIMNCEG